MSAAARWFQPLAKELVPMALLLFGALALVAPLVVGTVTQSLWVDELITAWVISGTLDDAVYRATQFQGQSPFFFLVVQATSGLFGSAEWVLRLPTVLSLLGCLALTAAIGRRIAGSEAGVAAAALLVTLWPLGMGTLSARPYLFALFWLLLSVWGFLSWLYDGRTRYGVAWAAGTLGAIYAHFMFAPVVGLHALLWLLAGKARVVRIDSLAVAASAIGLGLIPAVYQLKLLSGKRALYSFSSMPDGSALIQSFVGGALAVAMVFLIPLLLSPFIRILRWTPPKLEIRGALWGLLGWVLLPSLALFVGSHVIGHSVFLPRYYAWFVPGLSIMIAVLLMGFGSRGVRAVVLALPLVFLGWHAGRQDQPHEDWRGASEYLRDRADNADVVLLWSGLTESKDVEWIKDPETAEYLISPVAYYEAPGRAVPLFVAPASVPIEDFLPDFAIRPIHDGEPFWVIARQVGEAAIAAWISGLGLAILEEQRLPGMFVWRVGPSS